MLIVNRHLLIESRERFFPAFALTIQLPLCAFVHFGFLLLRLCDVLLHLPRHPSFNRRARVSLLNNPDGHIEGEVEFLAKVIRHDGSLSGGLWIAGLPLSHEISLLFQRLMPVFAAGFKDTEVRQVDIRLQLRLGGIARGPAHVGLPGAEPHFANCDILDLNGLRAGDFQRMPSPERRCIQEDLPPAVRIGLR